MPEIDLHAHSNFSDGTLSPAGLLEAAARAGLTHLALTDHDTVAGIADAALAAAASGVALVCGIEISAFFNGREIHVLGHFVLPAAPSLADLGERMGVERTRRMDRMIERLSAAGFPVSRDEVLAESGGRPPGRPHLARVLVRRGHADGFSDAFRRFLSPGRPGWADRERPSAEQAVETIRAAGGTSSLAHPGVDRISRAELAQLAALGLDAVEAFHPDHPPSQSEAFVRWGRENRLEVTGGSDCHGMQESHPPGTCRTPPASFRALQATARARAAAPALALAAEAWRALIP